MSDNTILNDIDHFLTNLKQSRSYYSRIDLYFIFTLVITEYEIKADGRITNDTASALCQLFAFQAHELFFADFPELYKKAISLFNELVKYNSNLENNEIVALGIEKKDWTIYLNERMKIIFY